MDTAQTRAQINKNRAEIHGIHNEEGSLRKIDTQRIYWKQN